MQQPNSASSPAPATRARWSQYSSGSPSWLLSKTRRSAPPSRPGRMTKRAKCVVDSAAKGTSRLFGKSAAISASAPSSEARRLPSMGAMIVSAYGPLIARSSDAGSDHRRQLVGARHSLPRQRTVGGGDERGAFVTADETAEPAARGVAEQVQIDRVEQRQRAAQLGDGGVDVALELGGAGGEDAERGASCRRRRARQIARVAARFGSRVPPRCRARRRLRAAG